MPVIWPLEVPDRSIREFLAGDPDYFPHPVLRHVGETVDETLDNFRQGTCFVVRCGGSSHRHLMGTGSSAALCELGS